MTGWPVGDPCGLYLDLAPGDAAAPGDWVATDAGARYLITTARRVATARHAQRNRYQLRAVRLDRSTDPPPDVHVWWLTWYRRARVSA